ncbi:MAG TPA: TIGR03667 family PPOX class F420-dependent oxidoreductase [Acidimicrobiia bacterium]|nr:TIGR03667 family PPOX class F420-dependent oxidoreductase [Acidimicrobiia bacterium]
MQISETAAQRLREELIIWLTTVTPTGRPQTSPVWFLWEGGEFLIYSLADTARVRNLAANPHVALNLDGDGLGGGVVSFEGIARFDVDAGPASAVSAYVEKYRDRMIHHGWTPEEFSRRYPVAIRITTGRVRTW